jgi:hypothetical protein
VLATLAPARVVTRDLVVSQNKNFGRNPSWSYVKPVVTCGYKCCIAVLCRFGLHRIRGLRTHWNAGDYVLRFRKLFSTDGRRWQSVTPPQGIIALRRSSCGPKVLSGHCNASSVSAQASQTGGCCPARDQVGHQSALTGWRVMSMRSTKMETPADRYYVTTLL